MRSSLRSIGIAFFLAAGVALALQGPEPIPAQRVVPQYDGDGNLLLPEDYREWRFVGSSLGLSYSEGPASHEMFHHTLMEPTAYEHYTRTGEFREGTMFVLLLHGTGEGELPQRRGRFAAEIHGLEMAVKDGGHLAESWGYYNFGGMNGIRDRARAMPASACYGCHAEHARRDHVFTQFYPLLESVAPAAPTQADPVAVKGLDPSCSPRGAKSAANRRSK